MSEQVKDGGPAFPLAFEDGAGKDIYVQYGMKLRDYFAGAALPSIINECKGDTRRSGECQDDYFARIAYEVADAMLAAREAKS